MTTNPLFDELPTFNRIDLTSISSDQDEDWLHPVLEIFRPQAEPLLLTKNRLYLVPTLFGDEFDPDFAPEPTSAEDLPELSQWCANFARNVLEVFAGRRQSSQLTKQFHFRIFGELVKKSGSEKEVGIIRKLHISQPLDGVCETTVTVRFGNRLRALVFRFEGVDKRWLCTALTLL
jgi:Family of unknown function (DUF6459)